MKSRGARFKTHYPLFVMFVKFWTEFWGMDNQNTGLGIIFPVTSTSIIF